MRWLILIACLSIAPAHGAESREQPRQPERVPYVAAGAPREPKVSAQWNRYYDYGEATALLKRLAAAHPDHARLVSLGRSHGGRELWLLTVTEFARGDAREKPAFWLDGGIHANEVQSVEAVLYTAWYLLEMRAQNERIEQLLRRRAFYIMPMMSPDGREAHMYQPATMNTPRGGTRPFDDDNDGLVDEDPVDDLDGDGHITQMRVRDPNGRYKPHEKFPRVMVRAEADEPGTYRLLGQEGYDNDGDGRVNEDGLGYYDPNRDWPWQWQPRYVQTGAARYPLDVRENRAVARFIIEHPNIAGAQSLHNTGGMIIRGPGLKSDHYPAADRRVFDALAQRGTEILPNYRYLALGDELYSGHGVEIDWFFRMRGVFAFTNELFTPRHFFRDGGGDGFVANKETRERFDRYLLLGEGTVEWHEVEHPQYGTIEVGGMKKNWGRQPPSFMLEEESHRTAAFLIYHAQQLPLLEIGPVRIDELDGGLTQVTATISNRRLTPTHAAADLEHNITRPDLISIALRDEAARDGREFSVVAGLISDEPYFIDAREQAREPHSLRVENIPGMGAVHVRWLVRGDGPYTIRVDSEKGGRARWP